MGHGPGRPVKTCGRSHGHGGRSSSSSSTHLIGSGPGRPVKIHGPPHGPGGAAQIKPTFMGRSPARHIKFREDGPRPGPAHQFFRGWAAARPGPSKFQRMGRGPTQPVTFSNFHGWARPGPSIFLKSRPGPSHFQKSRPGPDRPVTIFRSARPGPAQTNGP